MDVPPLLLVVPTVAFFLRLRLEFDECAVDCESATFLLTGLTEAVFDLILVDDLETLELDEVFLEVEVLRSLELGRRLEVVPLSFDARGRSFDDLERALEALVRSLDIDVPRSLDALERSLDLEESRSLEPSVRSLDIEVSRALETLVRFLDPEVSRSLETIVRDLDLEGSRSLEPLLRSLDPEASRSLETIVRDLDLEESRSLEPPIRSLEHEVSRALEILLRSLALEESRSLETIVRDLDDAERLLETLGSSLAEEDRRSVDELECFLPGADPEEGWLCENISNFFVFDSLVLLELDFAIILRGRFLLLL